MAAAFYPPSPDQATIGCEKTASGAEYLLTPVNDYSKTKHSLSLSSD
ncbi:MAG: hypothetical protein ACI8X5_000139 [Planctomycetota bacterium]|jgi:hypothetical protein